MPISFNSTPCFPRCARMQFTCQPLLFATQVCSELPLYSKKLNNIYSLQLPSPRYCAKIVLECIDVISLFLLTPGDLDCNPGTKQNSASSQNQPQIRAMELVEKSNECLVALLEALHEIKSKLATADRPLADPSGRMASLEKQCASGPPVRSQIK